MNIVFFDGHCNLCNAAVDFLIRHDHGGRLHFAPLSGETARRKLGAEAGAQVPGTLVFVEATGRRSVRSTGALRILLALGGVWRAWGLALAVPRGLRDPIYHFIARHRYGWFGRRDSCRVPDARERVRFLP